MMVDTGILMSILKDDPNENNRYDHELDNATSWGYWSAGGYAVVRGMPLILVVAVVAIV